MPGDMERGGCGLSLSERMLLTWMAYVALDLGETELIEELWEEFFADPWQWWDNRFDKVSTGLQSVYCGNLTEDLDQQVKRIFNFLLVQDYGHSASIILFIYLSIVYSGVESDWISVVFKNMCYFIVDCWLQIKSWDVVPTEEFQIT